jgi:glycine cleavage system H lipoate-binding protein|nr:MAG TPA: hypothetical protein [Caudoviricetes sp.]
MNVIVKFLDKFFDIETQENVNHFWLTIDTSGEISSHLDSPVYSASEEWFSDSKKRVAHIGHTLYTSQAKGNCSFYTIKHVAEKVCEFASTTMLDVVKFMATIKPDNLTEGFIKMVASHLNNADECVTFKDGILYCYDTESRNTRILISQNRVYTQNDNLAFCIQVNGEGVIVGSGWEYEAVNTTPEIMSKEAALSYCMPIDDKNLVIFAQMAMSAWKKAEEVDSK